MGPGSGTGGEGTDRRLLIIGGFAALLAVVVAVVALAGNDSGDGGSAEAPTKPTVEVPEGPPPNELVVEDLEEGDGATAEQGDQVTVHYVGVDYETGEEFDSSYDSGQPFPFQIGGGNVIEGWERGVQGMKEGGRRQLVIPPDLAYGPQGQPPTIAPNATLVFVVDLLSVGG